jgi:N-acetylmuramoyl-L-alanine amidase
MIKRVVLDAGHGGSDPGASGKTVAEKVITLGVALKLRDILLSAGIEVLLTRETDQSVSLQSRVQLSNDWGADLFVSIHCNAYLTQIAHGIETWYYTQDVLAQKFQTAMMARFPDHTDRGIKKASFYVLKYTVCPAVLVELEFISTPEQEEFLKNNIDNEASVLSEVILAQ